MKPCPKGTTVKPMLPLIIRATEHEAVLYPDTHTGEMETCVNECLSESEPFSIRVEAVSGSAFFEVVSHESLSP